MDHSYISLNLKKKYLYNVIIFKSKRDKYKVQQAISKAINTTGPSVVTFFNLNPPKLQFPPQAPPTHLTPPKKVNNKEKDNAVEECIFNNSNPPPHSPPLYSVHLHMNK